MHIPLPIPREKLFFLLKCIEFTLLSVQRKGPSDKQNPSKTRNLQKISETSAVVDFELDDMRQNLESQTQKPKRPKRPTKSVNENLVPATMGILEQTQYPQ